jgi:hypothetical protein
MAQARAASRAEWSTTWPTMTWDAALACAIRKHLGPSAGSSAVLSVNTAQRAAEDELLRALHRQATSRRVGIASQTRLVPCFHQQDALTRAHRETRRVSPTPRGRRAAPTGRRPTAPQRAFRASEPEIRYSVFFSKATSCRDRAAWAGAVAAAFTTGSRRAREQAAAGRYGVGVLGPCPRPPRWRPTGEGTRHVPRHPVTQDRQPSYAAGGAEKVCGRERSG